MSLVAEIQKEVRWYEVWAMYPGSPPYLLFLWEDMEGRIEVYDPLEKKYRYSAESYNDAMYWLTEDEYTRVDGRMEEDITTVPKF